MDTSIRETIVTLDGVDKTGKSTIEKVMLEMSGYKVMGVDRSFMSMIAYARKYKRSNIKESYFVKQMIVSYEVLGIHYFLIVADPSVIRNRLIQNESVNLSIDEIASDQEIFIKIRDELMKMLGIEIGLIDTTTKTPEQCSLEILQRVKELELYV